MTPAALLALVVAAPADPPTRGEAEAAMKRAATFFREKAAVRGGYVFYYSLDLADRWGEGKADADTVFVQPPGTPTVGRAFLAAYEATGDRFYLDAARAAAGALLAGQLRSGGWAQTIHFGPAKRLGKYRNGTGGSWNASTLDDDTSQAALRFLVRLDKAVGFRDAGLHEAAEYALAALLKAQFPNGGFPQVWTGPVPAKPVLRAKYPEGDWRTDGRVKNYWDQYTLNDGLAGTVADTLIEADRVYGGRRYRDALARLGDFLLLARMPDPQPAWCQQYGDDMAPIWGRKFEPPAVSGWESQDVLEALVRIARHTGDRKYLEPIPAALAYLRRSLLPDGRLARFYELRTNRPLYMDAAYRLTYDDAAAPAHYGWKQPARLDRIERLYRDALGGVDPPAGPPPSADAVRRVIADLDADGRWVSTFAGERLVGQPPFRPGFRYLSSAAFARNVETLAAYSGAGR